MIVQNRSIHLPKRLVAYICIFLVVMGIRPTSFVVISKPSIPARSVSDLAEHAFVKTESNEIAEVERKHQQYSELYPFMLKQPHHFNSVEVTATGYSAGYESTGKHPGHPQYGITYSGVKVRRADVSTIAADPKLFPVGTVMYIPGYGYGVVADTGSAIKGKKIDLYFHSVKDVYAEWGKKKVNVFIMRMGTGKLNEDELNRLNEAFSVIKRPPSVL